MTSSLISLCYRHPRYPGEELFSLDAEAYFNAILGRLPLFFTVITFKDLMTFSQFQDKISCLYLDGYFHLYRITRSFPLSPFDSMAPCSRDISWLINSDMPSCLSSRNVDSPSNSKAALWTYYGEQIYLLSLKVEHLPLTHSIQVFYSLSALFTFYITFDNYVGPRHEDNPLIELRYISPRSCSRILILNGRVRKTESRKRVYGHFRFISFPITILLAQPQA